LGAASTVGPEAIAGEEREVRRGLFGPRLGAALERDARLDVPEPAVAEALLLGERRPSHGEKGEREGAEGHRSALGHPERGHPSPPPVKASFVPSPGTSGPNYIKDLPPRKPGPVSLGESAGGASR